MNKEEIKKMVTEVILDEPDGVNIQSISLFGSFLHGDDTASSDVDLLFEMKKKMTLFQIGGIQYRLQEKLGRKVDFIPKNAVIPQLRDKIIPEAEQIYEGR